MVFTMSRLKRKRVFKGQPHERRVLAATDETVVVIRHVPSSDAGLPPPLHTGSKGAGWVRVRRRGSPHTALVSIEGRVVAVDLEAHVLYVLCDGKVFIWYPAPLS